MANKDADDRRALLIGGKAVNKKFLTVGMIMPLVAAGAISTAPDASAATHHQDSSHLDRLTCTLTATIVGGRVSNRIRVEFKLYSGIHDESKNYWKVQIKHGGYQLVNDYMSTFQGRFAVTHMAGKTRGTDWFTATATNLVTNQQCRVQDAVRR
jgi:hypothetical protein